MCVVMFRPAASLLNAQKHPDVSGEQLISRLALLHRIFSLCKLDDAPS